MIASKREIISVLAIYTFIVAILTILMGGSIRELRELPKGIHQ